MRKLLSFLLCTAMIFGIFTLPSVAASVNTQVIVKTTNIAPKLDGVVKAGEYGEKIHSVDYSNDEFISEFDTDKNINADFYMVWTDDGLYMSWVVHTDGHWPVSADVDYNNDMQTGTPDDLAYMWQFSSIQFMLCTGTPDTTKQVYQYSPWCGNYLEAGLSILSDGSSYKLLWCKPARCQDLTTDDWDFMGARDDIAKTTTYEVKIPFSAIGMTNIEEGTKLGLSYSIGDQENFDISPNMCEWQDAMLGGKNMDAGAVITLSSEGIDGSIVGKPVKNPDYTISVTTPKFYKAEQIINVNLTLTDIPEQLDYTLIKFLLYYDENTVEPIIKNDGDLNHNMDVFLKNTPHKLEKWEGFCKLEEANSFYDISFFTIDQNSVVNENEDLVISIPFKVKSNVTEDIMFQVPNASTMCSEFNLIKHYGNAGKTVVSFSSAPPIELVNNSGLIIDDKKSFLKGIKGGMKVSFLQAKFKGSVIILGKNGKAVGSDDLIGTGFIISNGELEITVVLSGDGNGDGKVDSKDYLIAKRAFLGSYKLDGAMLKAICIGGGTVPTSKDYLMIKRHFLGTYNLYEKIGA